MKTTLKNNLLSSLPVFLLGCGITAACLIANGACYEIPTWRLYSSVAVGFLAALIVAVVSIVGLVKKIPDWSVTWISVLLAGLFMLLNFKLDTPILAALRVAILVVTVLISLWLFAVIASRPWYLSALLGIGLSSMLSILLFFIATNVSHDLIKLGYYAAPIGLLASSLLFFFNTMDKHRILLIIVTMLLNGVLIYVFDTSMQKLGTASQLGYLLFLSVLSLFSGIILRQVINWLKLVKNKIQVS